MVTVLRPPADSPNTVTLLESPPKAAVSNSGRKTSGFKVSYGSTSTKKEAKGGFESPYKGLSEDLNQLQAWLLTHGVDGDLAFRLCKAATTGKDAIRGRYSAGVLKKAAIAWKSATPWRGFKQISSTWCPSLKSNDQGRQYFEIYTKQRGNRKERTVNFMMQLKASPRFNIHATAKGK